MKRRQSQEIKVGDAARIAEVEVDLLVSINWTTIHVQHECTATPTMLLQIPKRFSEL